MADKKERKKKNTRSSTLGLVVWVLAALVLLVLFLFNQNRIVNNLKSTDFFNKVVGKTPSFVENHESAPEPIEKNDVEPIAPIQINLGAQGSSSDEVAQNTESSITASNSKAREQYEESIRRMEESSKNAREESSAAAAAQEASEQKTASSEKAESPKPQPKPQEDKKPVAPVVATMNIKLYFMEIKSDGSVKLREVTRAMKKSNSPLVDAINALIQGPNAEEEDLGCRTLLSDGCRILSASVVNGVARLNFSQELELNKYGIEGLRGQLKQIVYTATAFPTVDSVQFQIEGERREFLGSEGVFIGAPLDRNSF